MNLPNKLTVGRFFLTAVFLVVFFARTRYADSIALFIFVLASLTDYWDGEIARKRNLITDFGILMDPLADKILVCSAFIAFVESGIMPAWMTVIIVARELAITGLRMLAASKNKVLAAERYGKHKTISQMVAIISILVMKSYPEWGAWSGAVFDPWVPKVAVISMWVSVFLTAFSGALYLIKNRHFYLDDL
jgi:CDP-diacylglycerol---glycerol-3-phosphate 3-phosphatidyltransferase